jgi:hypothetical protein
MNRELPIVDWRLTIELLKIGDSEFHWLLVIGDSIDD